MIQLEKCPNPECDSKHITKAGTRITRKGRKARFQCQKCGRTFYDEVNEKGGVM